MLALTGCVASDSSADVAPSAARPSPSPPPGVSIAAPGADREFLTELLTDEDREPVLDRPVRSFRGGPHCGWTSVLFLVVGDRTYVRDPEGALRLPVTVPYDPDGELPADAIDTGYERGGQRLWQSADRAIAYLVTGDRVEVLPSPINEPACQ